MIGDIMQPTHLLFVLVIALLVLGPKRLPEVGRQLGKGLRDFRAAINGEHVDHHDELGAEPGHTSQTYQPPRQPVEHQFAHEAPAEGSAQQPFAHDAPAEGSAQQPFTHDAPAEGSAQQPFTHEAPAEGLAQQPFTHEAPAEGSAQPAGTGASPQAADLTQATDASAPPDRTDNGASGAAGEHEFAYESVQPAEKPVDPHS
jgi:sec-independent protein translocase protein TatA